MTAHNVHRTGNVISVSSLTAPSVIGQFLVAIYQGREKGYSDFTVDFDRVKGAFPNVCAPLAGILEYYRSEQEIEFDFLNIPDFVAHTKTLHPLVYGLDQSSRQSPLNTVWKFATASEIHSLVDACLDEVSRAAVCQKGVIQGLEWCLNEVMDNVLQHSETTHGYLMSQIHTGSQHIAICIYDYGQGIYNSLRTSSHAPRTALDAITVALKEGVTRDKSVGQGNGMWGLYNIVRLNSGQLNITSGPGFFGMSGESPKTSSRVPYLSVTHQCTTVDFQIDFDKGISIAEALGGYQPVNVRLENLQDEQNNVVYKLSQKATGTGTRQSGAAIRNEIINILRQTNSIIVLDFDGVSVVSSSFADELIGKLATEYGLMTFMQRFRLVGMNETVQAIANRSVTQRIGTGTAAQTQ